MGLPCQRFFRHDRQRGLGLLEAGHLLLALGFEGGNLSEYVKRYRATLPIVRNRDLLLVAHPFGLPRGAPHHAQYVSAMLTANVDGSYVSPVSTLPALASGAASVSFLRGSITSPRTRSRRPSFKAWARSSQHSGMSVASARHVWRGTYVCVSRWRLSSAHASSTALAFPRRSPTGIESKARASVRTRPSRFWYTERMRAMASVTASGVLNASSVRPSESRFTSTWRRSHSSVGSPKAPGSQASMKP